MSLNFILTHSLLLITISITILTTSSRPVTIYPQNNVVSTPTTKTLLLTTSDGEVFNVELHVALQSDTIRQMIVDGGFYDEIVLSFPNITSDTMSKVLEYCDKLVYYDDVGNNITAVDEMKAFDTQFVDLHYEMLFKLFRAANELKIIKLYDIVGGKIGSMIKGKTPEEIRRMFNINQNSCDNHNTPQRELKTSAFQ